MTNWSISGGADHTNDAEGLPSTADNDQGSIRYAGTNIDETTKWSNVALGAGHRFITIVSGVNGVEAPSVAGAFNAGDQVIRRVTTDIAGVSNTTLLTGGSDSANRDFAIKQGITLSSNYYKTAVRTGGWHEFSGVFSPAITVVNSGGWDQTTDSDKAANMLTSTTDNAANPTAAIPGELVYRDGSPTPNQDDYKAKTNY